MTETSYIYPDACNDVKFSGNNIYLNLISSSCGQRLFFHNDNKLPCEPPYFSENVKVQTVILDNVGLHITTRQSSPSLRSRTEHVRDRLLTLNQNHPIKIHPPYKTSRKLVSSDRRIQLLQASVLQRTKLFSKLLPTCQARKDAKIGVWQGSLLNKESSSSRLEANFRSHQRCFHNIFGRA